MTGESKHKHAPAIPVWLDLVLVVVLPAALYLSTLAPTLTWAHNGQDGGDLIAAVFTSGVPHPPGYPTYVLLGKLFALLPVGEPAYRLNLMSAVCAVLTTGLVYLMVRNWLAGSGSPDWLARLSALGAGWALALSPLLWSQAVIAEVYALNALLVALCLYLLRRWRGAARQARLVGKGGASLGWLLGLFLVVGLALGNHLTIALLAAPILVYLAVSQEVATGTHGPGIRVQQYWPLALALAAGLSVYLYLPWAARHDPPVNWGDPSTLERFAWVVSGGPYRAYVLALPWAQVPARLSATAHSLLAQFGPWGVALGFVGLTILWRRDRSFGLVTASGALLYVIYATGYDTADSYVYLIPAFLLFAVWIGVGAHAVLVGLQDRWAPLVGLAGTAWLAIILAGAWANWDILDLSHDRAARDWAAATLAEAPERGLVITGQDGHTFGLWYFQHVEGIRPDVVVVDRDLLGYAWYRQYLRVHHPELNVESVRVRSLIADNPGRPTVHLSGLAAAAP